MCISRSMSLLCEATSCFRSDKSRCVLICSSVCFRFFFISLPITQLPQYIIYQLYVKMSLIYLLYPYSTAYKCRFPVFYADICLSSSFFHTSTISPSNSASTSFINFIASTIQITCPFFTLSPFCLNFYFYCYFYFHFYFI